MEYTKLIGQAWTLTWRYRFLWLLGILAGGAVGIPSLSTSGQGTSSQSGAMAQAPQAIEQWTSANATLLVFLAILGVALIVALVILSFIAQGGMAQATADLAEGHPSSLRRAWSAGRHLFWRYVGLWCVLIAGAVVLAAVIAALVAAVAAAFAMGSPVVGVLLASVCWLGIVVGFTLVVVNIARERGASVWLVATLSAIFAVPVVTVLLATALSVSILVAFAQRAIAVERLGPVDALRAGWRLERQHIRESFLTWLVNLGLAFVAYLAVIALAIVGLTVLGGLGALVYFAAGVTAPTITYAVLAGTVFIVAVFTLAGIVNAFFWMFWTLVYLRLTGRALQSAGA